jgi:hypothetical protein
MSKRGHGEKKVGAAIEWEHIEEREQEQSEERAGSEPRESESRGKRELFNGKGGKAKNMGEWEEWKGNVGNDESVR